MIAGARRPEFAVAVHHGRPYTAPEPVVTAVKPLAVVPIMQRHCYMRMTWRAAAVKVRS
jgi:hypothetical protein